MIENHQSEKFQPQELPVDVAPAGEIDRNRNKKRPPQIDRVQATRCLSCKSYDLEYVRSTEEWDGSRLQRLRCKECGQSIHRVIEKSL